MSPAPIRNSAGTINGTTYNYAGGAPIGAERAVAAWVLHTRGLGAQVNDAKADVVASLGAGTLEESVAKASDYLGITDAGARESILTLARELEAAAA